MPGTKAKIPAMKMSKSLVPESVALQHDPERIADGGNEWL
jgi:hypothetical protein